MPFKKLIEPLRNAIINKGFESPLPFQKQILSKIKGGSNVFGIAAEGLGKTTSLILSVVQKLKGEAFEDAPRALIIVKDKQEALNLELEFNAYTSETNLRTYCAYEEHNIDAQRDEIYVGVDILIATPKRLNKLFLLNSINLSQLQLFIVEDAEFLSISSNYQDVNRISESITKCQYLVFAKTFNLKIERLRDLYMYNSQVVKVN